jgi:hypothetical protein
VLRNWKKNCQLKINDWCDSTLTHWYSMPELCFSQH